jgi:hypothetical protein
MKKYSSTLNIFDDSGDFTRPSISAKDLVPIKNQNDRFQTDALINGRTRYEENNTIIKSLQEEIVSMKHKMSFVYEKDEEISTLKDTILKLKKQISELESITKEYTQLKQDNKQLKDTIDKLHSQVSIKDTTIDIIDIQSSDEEDSYEEMIDIHIPKLRNILTHRLQHKQAQHIENLISKYNLKKMNKVKKSVMEKMLEEAIHL